MINQYGFLRGNRKDFTMKNLQKSTITASLLPLLFTMNAHATSQVIAEQDFSNYYINNKWTLIDDNYDLNTMIENGDSRKEAKAKFVENGEMFFDASWTQNTLKLMYPDAWPDNLSDDATEDEITARKETIEAIRAQACDVKIEVGKASTYGASSEGYKGNVTELDTDGYYCNDVADKTVGTVSLRSFIPTVPGAEYEIEVMYRQRDYNWKSRGAASEKDAYRDLVVRVGSDVHQLPLDADESSDAVVNQGFIVDTRKFTAEQFFTKVNLKDRGYSDEYGVLVRSVKVTEVTENPNEETCNTYHNASSSALKNCLLSESEPELLGCDLSQSEITWTQGANVLDYDFRANTDNLFYSTNTLRFLSLGQGGKLKVQLQENEVDAACAIAGKTLSFDEITWFGTTYEEYAEKGIIKAKFVGCTNEDDNGWQLLTNDLTNNKQFITQDSFSHTFSSAVEDQSCALTAIKFIDKTDKIPSTQEGYVEDSDGVDINNLALTE